MLHNEVDIESSVPSIIDEQRILFKEAIDNADSRIYQLEEQIKLLEEQIKKTESEINAEKEAYYRSHFPYLFSLVEGAVVCTATYSAFISGRFELGKKTQSDSVNSIERINEDGLALDKEKKENASNASKKLNLPCLINQSNEIKTQLQEEKINRRDYQKKLYELEKSEAQNALNKPQTVTISPELKTAIEDQFDEIDRAKNAGQFSKTYIQLAINTRKIIEAKNEDERISLAKNHAKISLKEWSVDGMIFGAGLMMAGAILGAGFLAALVFNPLFYVAPSIFVLPGAGCLIKEGFSIFKESAPKWRPPRVVYSMFNVQNKGSKKASTTEPGAMNPSFV